MNKLLLGILMAACAAISGCEEPDSVPPAGASAANQTAPTSATPLPATPPPAAQPVASEPPVVRQAAEAGVGKKGQGYGGGIITEPVHQYFIAQDRIIFEIQIPQAMKLFQAEKNRYPKDMAEFQRDPRSGQYHAARLVPRRQIRLRRPDARADGRAQRQRASDFSPANVSSLRGCLGMNRHLTSAGGRPNPLRLASRSIHLGRRCEAVGTPDDGTQEFDPLE